MPVIKTQFMEVTAKRKELDTDSIQLGSKQSNINLRDVKEMKTAKKAERTGVVFVYEYTVSYPLTQPKGEKLGNIKIVGEIFYVDEAKKIKTIIDGWKKDNKLSEDMLTLVLNVGLNQATIEAIYQANKVEMPSPIPLPHLKPAKKGGISSAG